MGANGRVEAYDILPSRSAGLAAARILDDLLVRTGDMTDAELIALAHALAAYIQARKETA